MKLVKIRIRRMRILTVKNLSNANANKGIYLLYQLERDALVLVDKIIM